ncbi:MAG: enoyl-CoA hydratase/isomerase family protein [Phycisphaerae bacterium]|nr:enoyl-CoA hydratase/isomerase family protein [Gemmatimonadaceae bacterium]
MTTPEDAVNQGGVTTAVADGIGALTFHHPKGNSLPARLLAKLAEEVNNLSADASVRVITLQSEGTGAFCAGASFEELTSLETREDGQRFFSGFGRVILAMIRSPKFIITGVQGKAAGGAVGLVAASDYSFAVRTASAKLSELAVGLGPFVIGPVIEKKIGLAPFSGMAVDADWRDAEWCERHGLYTRVCDNAPEMRAAVTKLATTLAASNPEAMTGLKQVFWQGTEEWDDVLAERAGMSGRLALSDFTRQAIGAFKAK